MNDIILILILLIAAGLALWSCLRKKADGGCSCGDGGCGCGCSHCHKHTEKK